MLCAIKEKRNTEYYHIGRVKPNFMNKYTVKNGRCYELFFRTWIWSLDKKEKIFPKKAKAFPLTKEVACHFCDICMS